MLARRTVGNTLSLPDAAVAAVGHPDAFDVTVEDGRLILTPRPAPTADAARTRLADQGLSDQDITEAVRWARRTA
jgi:hypothetical protein